MVRLAQIWVLMTICWPVFAATVRVSNPSGNITAKVVTGGEVRVRSSSPARAVRPGDTVIVRQAGMVVVECRPEDGARIDVEIDLPYGTLLEAATTGGAVSISGLVSSANITTVSGDLDLAVPWNATRLEISSENEPRELSVPKAMKFSQRKIPGENGQTEWVLSDRLPDLRITYGRIRVKAVSPGRIALADIPIPEDSPIKLPWQAPEILDAILSGRPRIKAPRTEEPSTGQRPEVPAVVAGTPVFTSDVRMVNLTVTVYDRVGHPLPNLKPEDFAVSEDGVPQKVAYAGSEEVPFNLAFLLDLSGSTRRDRPAMKEAARKFIGITRPHDRVAAYALANNLFQVISTLTLDRAGLLAAIDAIPDVSGGTPLYDAIVLAYAQEFLQRPEQRNALIVISDGVDNQLRGVGAESEVSFKKLRRAVAEVSALIYPVFLDPFDKVPPPGWSVRARERLQMLADASGGRLFSAHSIHDLDPVYPQVADELRSVYTIAYYPQNQNFDGRWRQVVVRVKQPGVRVRTRAGYYAR